MIASLRFPAHHHSVAAACGLINGYLPVDLDQSAFIIFFLSHALLVHFIFAASEDAAMQRAVSSS